MVDEYRALNQWAAKFRPQCPALVVGSKCYGDKPDRRALYASAVGVDMEAGPGVDVVHNLEQPLPASAGMFRHLDCVSVLEHVRNPFRFCEAVRRSLEAGATLLVVVPFIWRIHGYPSDYWRFTPAAIRVLWPGVIWEDPTWWVSGKISPHGPLKHNEEGVKYLSRTELAMFGRIP